MGEDGQTSGTCVSKEVEVAVAGTRFCVLVAIFSGVRVIVGQRRDRGDDVSAGNDEKVVVEAAGTRFCVLVAIFLRVQVCSVT
jgi:hypothetical protein